MRIGINTLSMTAKLKLNCIQFNGHLFTGYLLPCSVPKGIREGRLDIRHSAYPQRAYRLVSKA